ncbi:hypothetical protein EZJ58_3492 [Sodalis ligni]|uniref:Uncharacterized protein n=1 Tax=Sodalis ligni TaxID=2697027 RepID=A0A4R1NEI5_9GAMM|nr:hypothetical protein EZJ58_3492 [Sodalis ligni]
MDGAAACLDIVFPCCYLSPQTGANKSGNFSAGESRIAAASAAANRPVLPGFKDRRALISTDSRYPVSGLCIYPFPSFVGPLEGFTPPPSVFVICNNGGPSQICGTLGPAPTITRQPTSTLNPLITAPEMDTVPISLNHL